MINIKIILLVSLAAYMTCGGFFAKGQKEEDTEEYHPNCTRHGIGSSRVSGSDAVTYNIPPLDSNSTGYDRYQCGDVFLYAALDVLKFNGKVVPDVTPKTRPLVIKWDQFKLEVNGKHLETFDGIAGEGTINFLSENERDLNNSNTEVEQPEPDNSSPTVEPDNSSPTVEPDNSSAIVEMIAKQFHQKKIQKNIIQTVGYTVLVPV